MADQSDDSDVVSALAGWCEDRLRTLATDSEPLPNPDSCFHIEHCNENYSEFLQDLLQEQEIKVPEEGPLKEDWLDIALDFLRVHHMAATYNDEYANYTTYWNRKTQSKKFITMLNEATAEPFQEWMFNLAWDMATLLLKHKELSSENESSDDDDDEEEDGEEEDSSEEESESSSGSGGSDSGSEEDDDDELAGCSSTKKQKTDKHA